MRYADELASIRRRLADQADAIGRAADDAPGGGSTAMVCLTTAVTTYPTAAGRAYGVQVASLSCTEAEGQTPTVTGAGGTAYAINLGASIPPVGTAVLCTQVDGFLVFRYG